VGREDRVDDDLIFRDRRNTLTRWALAYRRRRRSMCRCSRDVLLRYRVIAGRCASMAGWGLRWRFRLQPLYGVSTSRVQMELAEAKAAVAGLPTLVYAPAFDGIDPATNEGLISLRYEVKKGPIHDFCGGQEAVVGAIGNWAGHRKPVED